VRETVVVVKRRVFPPLLCAIVLGVIPWRRFVSFRRAVYRFEPKSKIAYTLVVRYLRKQKQGSWKGFARVFTEVSGREGSRLTYQHACKHYEMAPTRWLDSCQNRYGCGCSRARPVGEGFAVHIRG